MLVIRNKMPPAARRERAGKSRLDNADGENMKMGKMSICSCNTSLSLENKDVFFERQKNVFHLESKRPMLRYPWCKEFWWEKEIPLSCHLIGVTA